MAVIAILSPGDMGHAVGAHLHAQGFRVLTDLAGRSASTRARARRSGFEDVGLDSLVESAELVLSILPPAAAEGCATRVADAMRRTGRRPVFVDCNAIAPATARRLAAIVTSVGAEFVDAGLIGAPPGRGALPTRLYASGPQAAVLEPLGGGGAAGLEVRLLGEGVGRASAMKMAYAALTKGTLTLYTAGLVAARELGVFEELSRELAESQPEAWARMGVLPFLPADAARWVGEMEEIAATFRDARVTDAFHRGAAEIFRGLAATPFAAETRETVDRSRTLEEAIRVFAASLHELRPADD
jgi:3-hydroxyisobutyrate dehydrogenase-like beta-hydroxyacid dehydrogenase